MQQKRALISPAHPVSVKRHRARASDLTLRHTTHRQARRTEPPGTATTLTYASDQVHLSKLDFLSVGDRPYLEEERISSVISPSQTVSV